jgi:HAD superfamily hydrolase (TIGR01509 family)
MSVSPVWVAFDLDGTLVETEQIWHEVRRAFVLRAAGRWTDDAQTAMIGMRTAEWAHFIHDELGVALSTDAIIDAVVSGVVARLREHVPVLPGAEAALYRLAAAVPLALATSAALPVAETVLAKTGWGALFRVVVSADTVARGKPAPDVYQRALALLGADPRRTVAVEDSANGIRSAHAAGTAVLAVPNAAYPPGADALALAARVLGSLDELDAALIQRVLDKR